MMIGPTTAIEQETYETTPSVQLDGMARVTRATVNSGRLSQ